MTDGLMHGAAALLLLCSIGGCANDFASREAIPADQIQAVVGDLKRQVSIYVDYQNSPDGRQRVIEQSATHECGNGLIDFSIESVKINLLMSTDRSGGAGIDVAGATPAGVTYGGGLSFSSSRSDVQELTFSATLLKDAAYRYEGEENVLSAPIAGALINLRNGLIESSKVRNRVCFQTIEAKDANSFKLGVTLTNKYEGRLTLGVAPLAFSASGETKGTTGNTLTVTFVPATFNTKPRWIAGRHGEGQGSSRRQTWQFNRPIAPKTSSPTVPTTGDGATGTGHGCRPGSTEEHCRRTWNVGGPSM